MTTPKLERWRLLVTGSRNCTPAEDLLVCDTLDRTCSQILAAGIRVIVVEGECPYGGVDLAARRWAEQTPGAEAEPHPANWKALGKAAGMIRNSEMVARGASLCLAFPAKGSRGTWDCVKKAADAGIPVRVYPLATA